MFEDLLPWQQIYHLAFLFNFSEQLLKFLVNFTLLKYGKSQRDYGFLITKELIFGFQILDLKDHFSASLRLLFVLPTEHSLLRMFLNIWRQIWFPEDLHDASL